MGNPAIIPVSNYNLTASVTLSGGTAAAGYDPDDILYGTEEEGLKIASPITTDFKIDFGQSLNFNAIGFLGEQIAAYGFEVRTYSDDAFSVLVDEITGLTMVPNDVNAAWNAMGQALSAQYVKITVTNLTTSTIFKHFQLCTVLEIPQFMKSDWENVRVNGKSNISAAGYFLGSTIESVLADFPFSWRGKIKADDALFVNLITWKNGGIRLMKPFFLMPDIDEDVVYFCWFGKGVAFSAPLENKDLNLAEIRAFSATTRLLDFTEV